MLLQDHVRHGEHERVTGVQKDGALFLTGMDTSAVSPALSAKLASLNALMIEVYAQADGLTGKACKANYFRANVNDSMIMNAVGQFLKDKPRYARGIPETWWYDTAKAATPAKATAAASADDATGATAIGAYAKP